MGVRERERERERERGRERETETSFNECFDDFQIVFFSLKTRDNRTLNTPRDWMGGGFGNGKMSARIRSDSMEKV